MTAEQYAKAYIEAMTNEDRYQVIEKFMEEFDDARSKTESLAPKIKHLCKNFDTKYRVMVSIITRKCVTNLQPYDFTEYLKDDLPQYYNIWKGNDHENKDR